MRDRRKEEKGFCWGLDDDDERSRRLARRRSEDRMDGLVVVVVVAVSRVSAAKIMLDWFESGILLRRVERSLWRSSGRARVSEINVAVCWRISDEVVVVETAAMVVVVVKFLGGFWWRGHRKWGIGKFWERV